MSVLPAATIWRDKEVDGVYSSDDHDPVKSEIREYQAWIEAGITAGTLNGPWEATLAALGAKLAYGDGNPGFVYAGADFGTYRKSGASGSGSWVKILDTIPGYQFVKAVDAGAGTANAIVATSAPPVAYSDGSQLIRLNIFETNTSGTVTVAFNGGVALTIETSAGDPPAVGGLVAGMQILGFVDQSATVFRMLSDQSGAAVLAQAEAFKDQAEAAAAVALGAVPNTFTANRTALAALPGTSAYAYSVEAGYQGQFELYDNALGVLDDLIAADGHGGEVQVTDTNPDLAYLRIRKEGDHIKLSEEGSDIHRAIAVAKERALLFGAGKKVVLENNLTGGAVLPSGIIVPDEVELVDLGKGKFIWDASGLDATTLVSRDATIGASGLWAVYAGPARASRYGAALPSFTAIVAGATWVDFASAHGLVAGDILHVQKYADSTFGVFTGREVYKMGHRSRIVGVEGNRVYLELPFRDPYTYSVTSGSEVLAHKQVTRKGRLGISVDLYGSATADNRGIYLSSFEGADLRDLMARGAGYAAITLDQCYDCRVDENCEASTNLRSPFPGTGTTNDYALSIVNSTKIDSYNPKMTANWHAYSLGGGGDFGNIQNYRCLLHDADLTNTGTSTPHSIDIHGNADDCGFINCRSGNGMSLNGRDPFAINCKIRTITGDDAKLLNMTELHSGKVTLRGCEFETQNNTGTGSNGGAIFGLVNTGSQGPVEFIFDGCRLDMPNEQQPIRLNEATGGGNSYSFYFSGHVNIPTSAYGIARLSNDAGNVGAYCRVPWVQGLASGQAYVAHLSYSATKTEFPRQSGTWTHTPSAAATSISAPITLPNSYPSFHTPRWSLANDNGAGSKASAKLFSALLITAIRPMIATGDGTNLTAAATSVAWEVW